MIHAPLEGLGAVLIGADARRTAVDYAHALEHIAEVMFPDAAKIVLDKDNLNTHGGASLYATFPHVKARALAERFERHHTPPQRAEVRHGLAVHQRKGPHQAAPPLSFNPSGVNY